MVMAEPKIVIELDGQPVRMNRFVRSIFINAILGMIRSLDNVDPEPRRIVVTIDREPAK
jgi:hypothetical protein